MSTKRNIDQQFQIQKYLKEQDLDNTKVIISAKDQEIADLKTTIKQITDYNDKVVQMVKDEANRTLQRNVKLTADEAAQIYEREKRRLTGQVLQKDYQLRDNAKKLE